MKATAARLTAHGKPLEITEIDLPEPQDDQVVAEMLYGGVNPMDRYRALGAVNPDAPLPRTLGAEGVADVDGRHFVVFGHGVGTTRDGIWATKAVVPKAALVEVPAGVDPRKAAVMGVAGVTAWRTVTELAEVTPEDRVLVLGASGGVGSVIVSLACRLGASVWGQTGDAAGAGWLKDLGVDRIVESGPENLADQVGDWRPTVVFDPLGGGFTGAALESMAPRGRLASFGTSAGDTATVNMQTLYRSALRILGYAGLMADDQTLQHALASALRALSEGRLDVIVDTPIPLSRADEAFERLEGRTAKGKLVLDLRS
jgi:NADPH:quinone reductase